MPANQEQAPIRRPQLAERVLGNPIPLGEKQKPLLPTKDTIVSFSSVNPTLRGSIPDVTDVPLVAIQSPRTDTTVNPNEVTFNSSI